MSSPKSIFTPKHNIHFFQDKMKINHYVEEGKAKYLEYIVKLFMKPLRLV